MKKWILFFTLLLAGFSSHAFVIDSNVFYFTDDTESDTDNSNAVTSYTFFIGFNLDKKGRYQAGWNYTSDSTEDDLNGQKEEYSSTQMGPAFVYFLDKELTWRLYFAYNLKTTADFTPTSGAKEEWRGTSMIFNFGYQLAISESFAVGVRLNYSSSDYDESVVGTTKEDVSFSKVMMYPSLAITLDL